MILRFINIELDHFWIQICSCPLVPPNLNKSISINSTVGDILTDLLKIINSRNLDTLRIWLRISRWWRKSSNRNKFLILYFIDNLPFFPLFFCLWDLRIGSCPDLLSIFALSFVLGGLAVLTGLLRFTRADVFDFVETL